MSGSYRRKFYDNPMKASSGLLALLVLNVVAWSWWWVVRPQWILTVLAVVVYIVLAVFALFRWKARQR